MTASNENVDSQGNSAPLSVALTETPVAWIRRQLAAISDEDELEELCQLLATDRRSSARALGVAVSKRREREKVERARIEALFEHRERLFEKGCIHVAGIDEVGVGPLAGPVVAAAVVLPPKCSLQGLNDSKKVSPAVRDRLSSEIRDQAIAFSIGEVSVEEIDRVNILAASLEAMRCAVMTLSQEVVVDHLLVDARRIPGIHIDQTPLIHGDEIDGSIAAASIVAKVYRDGLMVDLARQYPGYGFEQHKGYGTREHMNALKAQGACPAHRRSFAPVAAVTGG